MVFQLRVDSTQVPDGCCLLKKRIAVRDINWAPMKVETVEIQKTQDMIKRRLHSKLKQTLNAPIRASE